VLQAVFTVANRSACIAYIMCVCNRAEIQWFYCSFVLLILTVAAPAQFAGIRCSAHLIKVEFCRRRAVRRPADWHSEPLNRTYIRRMLLQRPLADSDGHLLIGHACCRLVGQSRTGWEWPAELICDTV